MEQVIPHVYKSRGICANFHCFRNGVYLFVFLQFSHACLRADSYQMYDALPGAHMCSGARGVPRAEPRGVGSCACYALVAESLS